MRDSAGGSYGLGGPKQAISFGTFLDRMASGDETLYLTTQPVAAGADGHPELLGQPLLELQGDLVLRPQLAGQLVPQQINLWMGAAGPSGASSGLHHDFHDNLYVLLRWEGRGNGATKQEGKLCVCLFSPTGATLGVGDLLHNSVAS